MWLAIAGVISSALLVGALSTASAGAVAITELKLPAGTTSVSQVTSLAGNVYMLGGAGLLKVSEAGAMTAVPGTSSAIGGATIGPDGNLWFIGAAAVDAVEYLGVYELRAASAVLMARFPAPAASAFAHHMVLGPDGALWLAGDRQTIYRYQPGGGFSEMTVQVPGGDPWPEEIRVGSDGALWYTNFLDGTIGRITTNGEESYHSAPTGPDPEPYGLALGADGALWFTEQHAARIGRIDSAGAIQEFPIAWTGREPSAPRHIVLGADGALWFTDPGTNAIGRLTTDGQSVEYPVPTNGAVPDEIAVGTGGILWFSEDNTHLLGRLDPNGHAVAPASTGSGAKVSARRACKKRRRPAHSSKAGRDAGRRTGLCARSSSPGRDG